jgi:predicted  nucleic acid-binding Zn-ribbon protein
MDDLARSVDPSNKTRELENEIKRIRTDIQTSDSRERLRLLANELSRALWRMNDLERELRDLDRPVPLFFQF